MLRFGIDLGGTKTEGVILDSEGRERFREREATDPSSYEAVLAGVERVYRRMCADARDAPHTLGVGTPGAVSHRTGLLKNSNTTCLNGMPLARDLRARLTRELAIMNDANCFALAEALLGAGRGKRDRLPSRLVARTAATESGVPRRPPSKDQPWPAASQPT
jgi:fructokinase